MNLHRFNFAYYIWSVSCKNLPDVLVSSLWHCKLYKQWMVLVCYKFSSKWGCLPSCFWEVLNCARKFQATILSGDPISIHRVISLSAGARAGTAECRHSSITRSRWFVLAAVQLLTCSCWGFESLCVGGKNKVDSTKISVLLYGNTMIYYTWRNNFWEWHHQSWFSVSFQMGVANFNFNFLSHFCINFQNLCAHHQEEILRFPKHPQKSSFWWVLAEKTAKNKVAPKIEYQKYFRKNLSSLEHHNLASDSSNWASRGCFGIVKTSSWRWAQRFFKLMHPGLSNTLKTVLINYGANCINDP